MNATDDDSPVCHASRKKNTLIQIYSPQSVNTRDVQNDLQHFLSSTSLGATSSISECFGLLNI
jgi:hypothetical protein